MIHLVNIMILSKTNGCIFHLCRELFVPDILPFSMIKQLSFLEDFRIGEAAILHFYMIPYRINGISSCHGHYHHVVIMTLLLQKIIKQLLFTRITFWN